MPIQLNSLSFSFTHPTLSYPTLPYPTLSYHSIPILPYSPSPSKDRNKSTQSQRVSKNSRTGGKRLEKVSKKYGIKVPR